MANEITVTKEVPLLEAFESETPVNLDANCATAVAVDERKVEVKLTEPGFWRSGEFNLEHSPWSVYNVSSGEYGPTVVFERDSE